jgi:hypothetical protein
MKEKQSAQEPKPRPKGNGSWIIQTYQGRWIDPVPGTLDQTVQAYGPGVNQTGSGEPVWFTSF